MYIKTATGIERVNVQNINSVHLTEVKDPEYDGTLFNVHIEHYNARHDIDLSFIDRHDADDFMENICHEITRSGSHIIDVSGLAAFADYVDVGSEMFELKLDAQQSDDEEQSPEE